MKKIELGLIIGLFILLSACRLPFSIVSNEETAQNDHQGIKIIDEISDPLIKDADSSETKPISKLDLADYVLFAGDLDSALRLYQEVLDTENDSESKAAALLGMGKAYYTSRNYTSAIDAFNRLLGQFPETDSAADAYFLLGESLFDTGEYLQAANAYARFAEMNPGALDDIARTYQGNAAFSGDDYNQAILAYQAALQATPPGNSIYLNLQIGKSYAALEDYSTAIQYYTAVYDAAGEDYSRSTANLLAGQTYLELGLKDKAYTRFMESVINFPKPYDSYTALSILINEGFQVNDFMRGIVEYHAGVYDKAIQSFERYIASTPVDLDGSIYYYLGLCYYYQENFEKAIENYNYLITNFPGHPLWDLTWEELAFTYWNYDPGDQYPDIGDFEKSAQIRLDFVTRAPLSDYANEFLFIAGRTMEINGQIEAAAQIWQRMMDEYPSAEMSYRGLFLAGISYFRLEQYEEALNLFQRYLVLGASPADKAKAYLWIGKAFLALGKEKEAKNAWELAENADPTNYYSIRAAELLDGIEMFNIEESIDLGYDLSFEKAEADSWLRTTFSIPTETDLDDMGELSANPRTKRISQLSNLGLFSEAIQEAELLRTELQGNALNSYRLMNFLVEKHLYQSAIYTCRGILDLAGMDDLSSLTAPIYFTHIRFGAYFRDLIVSSANENDLPILILYSLIRQESMFNPYIGSTAGALGLMQLIPSTALDNVRLLGYPEDFETADLFMGRINITLGAYHLYRMYYDKFSENMQQALAAYNAGEGNVNIWKTLAYSDPDLFLEVLRAQETQDYLMHITEFLNIYQLIYSRPQ